MGILKRACCAVAFIVWCASAFASEHHSAAVSASTTEASHASLEKSSPSFSAPSGTVTVAHISADSDIILLMDSSGSMKRTDAKNYRRAAAKLLVSLLPKNDRIGIVAFGDHAITVAPLTQNSTKSRSQFFKALDKLTSTEPHTNITEAIQKGSELLKDSSGRNAFMIMMSDGMMDLGNKQQDELAISALKSALPILAKSGVKIHTIAFTDEADKVLLEDIAKSTGGALRFAQKDRDVHLMFAATFEKMKSPDELPLEGDTFTIDRDIEEATLLVSKKPGAALSLTDPARKKFTPTHYGSNIAWFSSSIFDMVTIKTPNPGTWRISLKDRDSGKVYVLTNLKLKTTFDKSFLHKGDSILVDAWLEKGSGIVTERAMLDSTTFSAEIKGPDGKSAHLALASAAVTTSGKYSATMTVDSVGDYTMRILAQGKTFSREKTIQFKATEPPPPPVEAHTAPTSTPTASTPHVAESAPIQIEEAVAWGPIMKQFAIVNTLILLIIAIWIVLRKFMIKRRKSGS